MHFLDLDFKGQITCSFKSPVSLKVNMELCSWQWPFIMVQILLDKKSIAQARCFSSNSSKSKCLIEPLIHFGVFCYSLLVFLHVFFLTWVMWQLDRAAVHYTSCDWKDGGVLFGEDCLAIYSRQGQKTSLIQLCAWLVIKTDKTKALTEKSPPPAFVWRFTMYTYKQWRLCNASFINLYIFSHPPS